MSAKNAFAPPICVLMYVVMPTIHTSMCAITACFSALIPASTTMH